jgi:hypothetical protein
VSGNRRVYLPAAIGCAAAAALLLWAAATHAPALRVPPTIALLLAGVMVAAAWRLLQLHRQLAGAGDGVAALMLAGTATFALWIAVGSGARSCRVSLDRSPYAAASGIACRIPFGVGGVLAAVMALYAVSRWMRARRAGTGEMGG